MRLKSRQSPSVNDPCCNFLIPEYMETTHSARYRVGLCVFWLCVKITDIII